MALYLWDYGGHRVPHLARRTYGSFGPMRRCRASQDQYTSAGTAQWRENLSGSRAGRHHRGRAEPRSGLHAEKHSLHAPFNFVTLPSRSTMISMELD